MRFNRTSRLQTAAGPVLFGVAFMAPLIAQSLDALAAPSLPGLSHLQFGLIAGLVLGVVAAFRGRWV